MESGADSEDAAHDISDDEDASGALSPAAEDQVQQECRVAAAA